MDGHSTAGRVGGAWKAKEPITRFESVLLTDGIVSADEIGLMALDIEREVSLAFEFADASPYPTAASAFTDLYQTDYSVTGSRPEKVGA